MADDSSFTAFRETSVSIGVLCLTWGFVYLIGLGEFPLLSWDEGVYAYIAEYGVRHGQWIVPTGLWSGTLGPFLEKPPLAFWIQEIFLWGLGHSVVAVRLPSALATLVIALATYLFVQRNYGETTGLLAGFFFLIIPHLFAGQNASRTAAVDLLFVCFGTLFVYWVLSFIDGHSRTLIPAGLALAFAVLVKGFAAGIYAIILAPLVIARFRTFLTKETLRAAVVATAIVLPWPVYMYSRFGWEFVQEIFFEQVLGRAAGQGYSAGNALFSFMDYPFVKLLPVALDPLIYFLPQAVVVELYRVYKAGEDVGRAVFLVWWATCVPVFFAFAGNHHHYLFPMYPAVAILVARFAQRLINGDGLARLSAVLGSVGILLFSYRVPGLILSRIDVGYPIDTLETFVIGGTVPSGIGYVLTVLCGTVIVLGAGDPKTRGFVRKLSSSKDHLLRAGVLLILLPGLAAPTAIVWPGGGAGASWDAQQEQLAITINYHDDVINEEITLQNALAESEPLFPFAFYAAPEIEISSIENISTEYALVRTHVLPKLTREYTVLSYVTNPEHGNVALVAFESNRKEESTAEYDVRTVQTDPNNTF
ncbi:glycosyltransferase family 39 protein [Salarchaeum sp. JOR-1]|uniref:ArnT family glycosyltransferase n=1 Tax=Salarchaeum sp. JOR-1 TaxID=2599399 RepID=UPI0011988F08|nr:glycosyltransferase family 39 protein [Salarchaeum sp. JOR-1]QDX41034.1 hypothetical protein FQU85_09045 [Salarchaeum sp. JOR-1]